MKLNIKSAVSEREVKILQQLATNNRVIEIGSLLGFSTIQLAEYAKSVTSIDPHSGYPYYNPTPTLPTFLRNIEYYRVSHKVRPIVDIAQNVLVGLPQHDFTFIDCTGFYADTIFCLDNARTKVIACHDFRRAGCEEVERAVLDFVREKRLFLQVVDTLAIIS